jgi:hypothetical protein
MLNNFQKIACMSLLMVMAHTITIFSALAPDTLFNHQGNYRKYLSDLSYQMSFPTTIIQSGMYVQGYTQEEIDAVPAAFPFLYDGIYKRMMHLFCSEEFMTEVNLLLDEYEQKTACINCKKQRRQVLHQIIHKRNVSALSLAQGTTTRQLARMVEQRAINIDLLCRKQLAAFFVKYYLAL